MNSVKMDEIRELETMLNKILSEAGSAFLVRVEGRYNYLGIDKYDRNNLCKGTLKTGLTKRQTRDFLDAMLSGIDLYERKQTRETKAS